MRGLGGVSGCQSRGAEFDSQLTLRCLFKLADLFLHQLAAQLRLTCMNIIVISSRDTLESVLNSRNRLLTGALVLWLVSVLAEK